MLKMAATLRLGETTTPASVVGLVIENSIPPAEMPVESSGAFSVKDMGVSKFFTPTPIEGPRALGDVMVLDKVEPGVSKDLPRDNCAGPPVVIEKHASGKVDAAFHANSNSCALPINPNKAVDISYSSQINSSNLAIISSKVSSSHCNPVYRHLYESYKGKLKD